MIDLEAVKARNEARGDCDSDAPSCDFDDHYLCRIHDSPSEVRTDLAALIAEVEELRTMTEHTALLTGTRWCCAFHQQKHTP